MCCLAALATVSVAISSPLAMYLSKFYGWTITSKEEVAKCGGEMFAHHISHHNLAGHTCILSLVEQCIRSRTSRNEIIKYWHHWQIPTIIIAVWEYQLHYFRIDWAREHALQFTKCRIAPFQLNVAVLRHVYRWISFQYWSNWTLVFPPGHFEILQRFIIRLNVPKGLILIVKTHDHTDRIRAAINNAIIVPRFRLPVMWFYNKR